MSVYIPKIIRQQVALRANYCCEYCLLLEDDAFFAHQIDHIFPIKHGGKTILENLAYACANCNKNKGSDLATFFLPDKKLVGLFNPREHDWLDHFYIDDVLFFDKTNIGKATIKVLKMNDVERIIERQLLRKKQ